MSLAFHDQSHEENLRPERPRLVTEQPQRIESEQAVHEPVERYYDSVGRPRKLAAGAMSAIMREYKSGKVTAKQLAERYGVSVGLIATICYHTPKRAPVRRPAPAEKRLVVVPND